MSCGTPSNGWPRATIGASANGVTTGCVAHDAAHPTMGRVHPALRDYVSAAVATGAPMSEHQEQSALMDWAAMQEARYANS